MVVENLQTTPLLEWLLGTGWYDGRLFQTAGLVVFLLVCAAIAGLVLVSLRRGSAVVRSETSFRVGLACGVLVLPVLAVLVMCSNAVSLAWLSSHLGEPLANRLTLILGAGWTSGSLYFALAVVGTLCAAIYAVSWLVSSLMHGPIAATRLCGHSLAEAATDLARTSPRRVMALAWLAFREAIRRRVAIIFAAFVILILFGGWFIDRHSDHPARLYIQIVLNFTMYLTLLFALILATLSLPADIRDRTLHTVVTKPVRKNEIILGRVLGFTAMGTLLLGAIGTISYVFTVRSLNHTHELTARMLHAEALPGRSEPLLRGLTSNSHEHQHEVSIDPSGACTVDVQQDHSHELTISGSGDSAVYTLGPPQGQLLARVPMYGKLSFKDPTGKPVAKGINVGDEWAYRSFIAGQTAATALWTFDRITADRFPEEQFPDGIPVEMTIEVFRTHKGNMEKGVLGSLWLRNPKTDRRVLLRNFLAKKFATDVQLIPRTFITSTSQDKAEKIDLFRDMVSDDGRLEISLQCMEHAQYFGMAQADLYIRESDSSFAWNFFKGYVGIWMQMVLVLALGVMFSTFVSGPVALLATLMFGVIAGVFVGYITDLAGGQIVGGGPFESFIRIVTQENMISPLQPGVEARTAEVLDMVTSKTLSGVSSLLPPFGQCDFVDHVAYGFNVGPDLLLKCIFREIAFVVPVILLAYLCLKNREVAR